MDKLSPSQIFQKTIKYVVLRVAMPVGTAIISMIAMKIITAIVAGDEGNKMGVISTLIWLLITAAVYFVLNYFVGYRFHAGHMAIITDAVSVNMLPDNMDDLAKESTQFRFPSGNEFIPYIFSVRGSIQELQLQLNTFAENKMRVKPLRYLIRFCQWVVGHALSYTADLVLCYTFWRDGKTLLTSAADGVAVYWDSWKRMTSNVFIMAIEIIVGMALGFGMVFVLIASAFSPASGSFAGGLAGVVIGYLICSAAKIVVDTNLTLKSLDAYFEEAQYADYNAEEYENMCQYSKRYSKLYQKAVNEAFAPAPASNEPPAAGYGNDYSNY